MPLKQPRITVYLSPEERAEIATSAAKAGVSLSTFAKRVCLGMSVPSQGHKRAVQVDVGSDLHRRWLFQDDLYAKSMPVRNYRTNELTTDIHSRPLSYKITNCIYINYCLAAVASIWFNQSF